jgi:2-iminobutanoate/2-iminopropanoate deaminase
MSKTYQLEQNKDFPFAFSQAVKAGNLVFVSGQVGDDLTTFEVVGDTIEEQTAQCLKNVEMILAEAGLTLDHVVRVSAYLSHPEDFERFNKTYSEIFKAPYRARITGYVDMKDYLIEMEVIADATSVRE